MNTEIYAKVHDGTRTSGLHKNLCRTCAHSTVARGAADSEEVIYCGMMSRRLTHDVVECNEYYNRALPSLRDLYETAWILETGSDKKQYGFIPYKKWKENHPDDRYPG